TNPTVSLPNPTDNSPSTLSTPSPIVSASNLHADTEMSVGSTEIPVQSQGPPRKRSSKKQLPSQRLRPPRPLNMWVLFRKDHAKDYPGLTVGKKSRKLSEDWKTLPVQIKEEYRKRQIEEEAIHRLKYPDYKYRPKRSNIKKQSKGTTVAMSNHAIYQQNDYGSTVSSNTYFMDTPMTLDPPPMLPNSLLPHNPSFHPIAMSGMLPPTHSYPMPYFCLNIAPGPSGSSTKTGRRSRSSRNSHFTASFIAPVEDSALSRHNHLGPREEIKNPLQPSRQDSFNDSASSGVGAPVSTPLSPSLFLDFSSIRGSSRLGRTRRAQSKTSAASVSVTNYLGPDSLPKPSTTAPTMSQVYELPNMVTRPTPLEVLHETSSETQSPTELWQMSSQKPIAACPTMSAPLPTWFESPSSTQALQASLPISIPLPTPVPTPLASPIPLSTPFTVSPLLNNLSTDLSTATDMYCSTNVHSHSSIPFYGSINPAAFMDEPSSTPPLSYSPSSSLSSSYSGALSDSLSTPHFFGLATKSMESSLPYLDSNLFEPPMQLIGEKSMVSLSTFSEYPSYTSLSNMDPSQQWGYYPPPVQPSEALGPPWPCQPQLDENPAIVRWV
ncbi:hypothetical protein BGW38_004383, partial [Lunasporangiospora selenospora]